MNETTSNVYDEWNIGTLERKGIWGYYIAANYLGVILSCILLYSIIIEIRNNKNNYRKNSPVEIFIGGLCTGIIYMAISCGSQCLINVIANRFYGNEIACKLEALFHVSSILVQFFSAAMIAIPTLLKIGWDYNMSNRTAMAIMIFMWMSCITITVSLMIVSPIYLMANGLYCFYEFKSPAIAGWLLPGLLLSLIVMVVSYSGIYYFYKKIGNAVNSISSSGEEEYRSNLKSIILRSTMFVLILLLCWGFAAITSIYELTVGKATEFLVSAVGVGGVTHSFIVPIFYAYINKPHRRRMLKYSPQFVKVWFHVGETEDGSEDTRISGGNGLSGTSKVITESTREEKYAISKDSPGSGYDDSTRNTPKSIEKNISNKNQLNKPKTPSPRYIIKTPRSKRGDLGTELNSTIPMNSARVESLEVPKDLENGDDGKGGLKIVMN